MDTAVKEDTFTSVTSQRWQFRAVDDRLVSRLVQQHDIPDVVARLLVARGKHEFPMEYLEPSLKQDMPDPYVLKGMEEAATHIAQTIISGQPIGIFGDYDVDGATSSALLMLFFRMLGVKSHAYIPDRISEGYGPNITGFTALQSKGCATIITVDCGIVAFEPVAEAKALGMDIIIVDHHMGEATLPEAVAVVNPKRLDDTSGLDYMAAAGVTFMLLVALNRLLRQQGFYANRVEPDLRYLLDIVALGTVCDVVPLVGLNRAFVRQGLTIMQHTSHTGLRALMQAGGVHEAPNPYHLGYVLGPRINAGGRVGKAALGVELLTSTDEQASLSMAQELNRHNAERKTIESMVQEQAVAQIESQFSLDGTAPLLIAAAQGWHPGVIGIVAGRIKEQFYRPAAIIAIDENGIGKASARSITGVDLGAAIVAARQEGILIAGGGHAMAAGFSIEAGKIPELQAFLTSMLADTIAQHCDRVLKLDGNLHLSGVTVDLCQLLEQAGPYGAGNSQPQFMLKNVRVVDFRIVGEDHISVQLADGIAGHGSNPVRVKGIAFRATQSPLAELLLQKFKPITLAVKLQLNHWQGRSSAQLLIEDGMWV